MKIIKVDLARLRNEEWFNIFGELKGLVPVYGAENLGITGLYALLVPLHNKADQLLEMVRKSTYTEELKEIDSECNTVFRGLYGVVKNSRKLPVSTDQAAAERLYILLSSYRKAVLRSSYAEESSAMFNLLQDLQGQYTADVTALALGKWVDSLNTLHQRFIDTRDARDKEYGLKPTEDLKKIRPQVDELYKNMTGVIYAKLVEKGLGGDVDISPDDLKTGIYEDTVPEERRGDIPYNFVVAWNIVLKRYHSMLAARSSRKAKDENPDLDEEDLPEED
jgi:hypothetical protein